MTFSSSINAALLNRIALFTNSLSPSFLVFLSIYSLLKKKLITCVAFAVLTKNLSPAVYHIESNERSMSLCFSPNLGFMGRFVRLCLDFVPFFHFLFDCFSKNVSTYSHGMVIRKEKKLK